MSVLYGNTYNGYKATIVERTNFIRQSSKRNVPSLDAEEIYQRRKVGTERDYLLLGTRCKNTEKHAFREANPYKVAYACPSRYEDGPKYGANAAVYGRFAHVGI